MPSALGTDGSNRAPFRVVQQFPISQAVFAFSFALGRDQAPVSRQAWTKGAADKNVVIEIPNPCLVCNSIEERIIGFVIAIEVRRTDHVPVSWKSWPEFASDERGAGQIPDCRLTSAGIEKQIIGFVIAIEVRHADHAPVNGQSWSEGAADKNVVI